MEKQIFKFENIICDINRENSCFRPGEFKDKGKFQAIIANSYHHGDTLSQIIGIYVSLQKCHIFHDGNKRSSFGLFEIMLEQHSYYLIDPEFVTDAQIAYIIGAIDKDVFKAIIMHNIAINKFEIY